MNDYKMIKLIADAWLENGGDREGFNFMMFKILEELKRREQ